MQAVDSNLLLSSAQALSNDLKMLSFNVPITHWYNPLIYAWEPYADYIRKYASTTKKVLFLGMNPGPWGMAQTGIPFGEIAFVRDWLGIEKPVSKPKNEHPKRPIEGFNCKKSEVSGRRLWKLFSETYPSAQAFFENYFVANYCPLVFMEASGANRTPDKLSKIEQTVLYQACDNYLRTLVATLKPTWIVGVGNFAAKRAQIALIGLPVTIATILHPSPASPAANRDWQGLVNAHLINLGIWPV
jgi:single-strand selective monofunctional uracil DNA glycosylase